MDPRLDSDQEALRQQAREAARDHLAPRAAALDAEAVYPAAELLALGGAGLLRACVQPPRTSAGEDLVGLVLVLEELGRASAGAAAAVAVHTGIVARTVAERGDDEQRAQWLEDLLEGRRPGALVAASKSLLDDPGPGVVVTGSGDTVTLSGEVEEVPGASGAELFLVPATTETEDLVALYVLEHEAAGVSVDDTGPRLGLNGAGTGRVRVDGAPVSATQRLGPTGSQEDVLGLLLDLGRLAHAAVAVGIAEAAVDACLARVGEASPDVARSQSVQWMLADSATETEAARLLSWYAADRRRPDERREAAAMARLLAVEAAVASSRRAVQMYGSRGSRRELGVERLYRDAKAMEVHAGASEAQRAAIARCLLPDLA